MGSYVAQCGQVYWKNSSTSILLPLSVGCGGLTSVKSFISLGRASLRMRQARGEGGGDQQVAAA